MDNIDNEDIQSVPEPDHEIVDHHTGPLDDNEDIKYLGKDDPRRKEIENKLDRKSGNS